MSIPTVIILDCNLQREGQRLVYGAMQRLLAKAGIRLLADDHWNDDYAAADLLIGADPLPDSEVLLDTRILGQRALNRRTRLDVALRCGAAVAAFGGAADDAELDRLASDWKTDRVVLKYDWSARRNGVFLWPLDPASRKPFPDDFDPARDVFMAFQDGDPHTYKVEACGGEIIGGYVLLTRDMRAAGWQKIEQPDEIRFDPPEELRRQVAMVSSALLAEGAGYSSFDLMQAGDTFRIVEINTCGVGTPNWNVWPKDYADAYARGIIRSVARIETIPRYREIRERALRWDNDAQAPALPPRASPIDAGPSGDHESDPPHHNSAEPKFLEGLRRTENFRPAEIAGLISPALESLLRHAREHAPFYSERLAPMFDEDDAIDWGAWADIPFLHRQDIAGHRRDLLARRVPQIHGGSVQVLTAGTEGEPIVVSKSGLLTGVTSCIDVRFFEWHGVPVTDPMATIVREHVRPASGSRKWLPHWFAGPRGIEWELSSAAPVEEQVAWLRERGPIWLRTRPSLAQQMALAVREDASRRPRLLGILTSGEILTGDQRDLCREFLGHAPRDLYRLAEADNVALQCPASDAYHLQSEAVLVELLDADDNPCGKGETGRIVVTSLFSQPMPVIRYETGDVAVAGDDFDAMKGSLCVCGRRLMRLQAVRGRARNQLTLPDGRPPAIDSSWLHDLCGARLWQLVQPAERRFTLRLDTPAPPSADQVRSVTDYLASLLPGDSVVDLERAPLSARAGKLPFEIFLREVP